MDSFLNIAKSHDPANPYPYDEHDANYHLKLFEQATPQERDAAIKYCRVKNRNPLNPETAKALALELSGKVYAHQQALIDMLGGHWDVLCQRWKSKTGAQRKALLSAVWPDIPVQHRNDFQALRKESDMTRMYNTSYRHCFAWSYINLEDLEPPHRLLSFLHSRAMNTPSTFAPPDYYYARLALSMDMFWHAGPIHGLCMRMQGDDQRTYAELLKWDDAARRQQQQTPDEKFGYCFRSQSGLAVLEIQAHVYWFLKECTSTILHDKKPPVGFSPFTPQNLLLSTPEPSESKSKSFVSSTEVNAESPYRRPGFLDLSDLETLITARLDGAKAHHHQLRDDPCYFSETAAEVYKHTIHESARPKDPHRVPSVIFLKFMEAQATSPVKQVDLYVSVVFLASLEVFWWREASELLLGTGRAKRAYQSAVQAVEQKVGAAQRAYVLRSKNSPESPLQLMEGMRLFMSNPTGFQEEESCAQHMDETIGSLAATFEKLAGIYLGRLAVAFSRDEQRKSAKSPDLYVTLDKKDPLDFCFQELLSLEKRNFVVEVRELIDEITRLVNLPEYKQSARCNPHGFSAAGTSTRTIGKKESEDRLPLELAVETKRETRFANSPSRLKYDRTKTRTRRNVDDLRKAEALLDAFWAELEPLNKKVVAAGRAPLLLDIEEPLCRTEPWTGDGTTYCLERSLDNKNDRADTEPDIVAPKEKIKTKGLMAIEPAKDPQRSGREANSLTSQTIKVGKRAFKTFTAIFHCENSDSMDEEVTARELDWMDFVKAMGNAGFQAEKRYGSAWLFKPSESQHAQTDSQSEIGQGSRRAIQFHEPHPESKIPFKVLRRMERRLKYAFGWNLQTFQRFGKG
ncbi:MAG: hypothetical protein M1831_006747 [Alyxoria varia]|nr:MAG: hypothetical protein M1831_006747 [Alyxoria varia]